MKPDRYFTFRLVKGGPLVPVRLRWTVAADPDTGEALDRSPRPELAIASVVLPAKLGTTEYDWMLEGNGQPVITYIRDAGGEGDRAPTETTEREYDYLMRLGQWALDADPDDPAANPLRPIDIRKTKPAF